MHQELQMLLQARGREKTRAFWDFGVGKENQGKEQALSPPPRIAQPTGKRFKIMHRKKHEKKEKADKQGALYITRCIQQTQPPVLVRAKRWSKKTQRIDGCIGSSMIIVGPIGFGLGLGPRFFKKKIRLKLGLKPQNNFLVGLEYGYARYQFQPHLISKDKTSMPPSHKGWQVTPQATKCTLPTPPYAPY